MQAGCVDEIECRYWAVGSILYLIDGLSGCCSRIAVATCPGQMVW